MSNLFDVSDQLVFYKRYHSNPVNVGIHAVFVPTILYSSMVILHQIELFRGYTVTHLLLICFASYYVALHRPVGLLASGILAATTYGIDAGFLAVSPRTAYLLFGFGWIFQFAGHGIFERKRPALMDNLVQSLVTAPLFILFEFVFVLGMFPLLNAELQRRVTAKGSQKQA